MAHKILLVEDEEMIREMYNMALTQAGYEVDSVADGEAALSKLTQEQPDYDLILLDIMLPNVDGISILKAIKKPDSPAAHIPVFLLTNLGLDDLVEEALSLGADRYLVKSNILPQQMIEQIQAFFDPPNAK